MPTFFFENGESADPDDGIEAADLDAAIKLAIETATSMAVEAFPAQETDRVSFRIKDERGNAAARVTVLLEVKRDAA